MKTKISQLRTHLIRFGSITKLEAAQKYFVYGLKEQLNRLKFERCEIVTVMIPRPGRQAYAKYVLRGKS